MRQTVASLALALALGLLALASPLRAEGTNNQELKQKAVATIDSQRSQLSTLSDEIWAYAETALTETQSAQALADHAEQQGFEVQRGVSGMPTAFVASFGKGSPVIGVLGEYDALPRLSQNASPVRSPLSEGAPGHGCGHNLFGVGSLAAATAIKQLIEAGELKGTIRFFGTPAEEAIGGKIYMARDGLFDDLDMALSWHPSTETKINAEGSLAMVELNVAFRGEAAHAAYDPWNGRSALDGLELFTHALNLMREHVKPTVRIHYSIVDGGGAPNVVPESAKAALWIRDKEVVNVDALVERVKVIANGAAMAGNVDASVELVSGTYNMLINVEAAKVVQANMEWLGAIEFDESEQAFARELQRNTGVPEKGLDGSVTPLVLDKKDGQQGSTDVADVSWIVPTVDVEIATAPVDIPWHAWGVVAASGSPIGHRGMVYAAKVLSTTMIDLYTSPDILRRAREEFEESTVGHAYEGYIPPGPPPVPGR